MRIIKIKNRMKNNFNLPSSLEELSSSELIEVEGGIRSGWYYISYCVSWLTDVDYKQSEVLMNCI